jgi:hypothetical protein
MKARPNSVDSPDDDRRAVEHGGRNASPRRRLVKRLVLVAALATVVGCGGTTASRAPGATPAPGSTTGATSGGGSGTGQPGGILPSYTTGAATATVVVGGTSNPVSGGTCKQTATDVSGVATYTFDFVAGSSLKPGWLEIHITNFDDPIVDGQYKTGLSTVTAQFGTDPYLFASGPTINLRDGTTTGDFAGTSAGNPPKDFSGTFKCG